MVVSSSLLKKNYFDFDDDEEMGLKKTVEDVVDFFVAVDQ